MKTETKVIIVSIFAALLVWILDSVIDYFIFYKGTTTFLGMLITQVPAHEVYIRLLIGGAFIIFGWVLSRYFANYKRTLQELFRSEVHFSTTLQSIGDAVIATDADGKINFMNPVAEKLTGWSAETAYGLPIEKIFRIVNEFTKEKVENPIEKVLKEGLIVGLANHTVLIAKDDTRYPIEDSGAPIIDKNGKIIGTVLVFHDITERREVERKIHQSEEQKRLVLENMITAYALHEMLYDDDGNACDYRFIGVNQAFIKMVGIPDPTGKTVREALPNVEQKWIDIYAEVVRTGQPKEFEEFSPSAGIWWHVIGYKVQKNQFATIFKEITERKLRSEQIRKSKEFTDKLIDTANVMIVGLDDKANITVYNNTAEKISGYSKTYMKSRNWFETIVPREKYPYVWDEFERIINTGNSIPEVFENPILTKSGEERIISWRNSRIEDSEGNISTISFGMDITERKRAEEALANERERLAVTLLSIGDGVIATDTGGRIVIQNKVAAELTGWDESEAFGKKLSEIFQIINEKTRKACENPVEKVLQLGNVVGLANHTVLISRDGKERAIADSGAPIRNKNGEIIGVVLVFRDVTETNRLQEFAARAQRLETAGRIAGQVAHDFNNLLGPLTAYPGLIKDELEEDHPAHEFLDQIQNSALQMAEINQQLLTLGRRGHYNLEPVNLNEIVNQVLMQYYPLAQTAVIEKNLSPELFNMLGGRSQIFRVLSNLVSNALDAISEVGKIVITTENYYVDSLEGKYGRVPQGEYVKFTLTDNGCGIAPDSLPKIFDPFFTTKSAEGRRGSGLGLSIVYAVVEDHNGYLDLSTTIGKGTSFYLYFPITRENIKNTEINDKMLGGKEKILIVDDDLTQREVTRILLEKMGYNIKTCESGENALKILRKEKFDLLLLDMIMPGGIDGTDTYAGVLKINPDQKAIIISGFAENMRVKEALELGAGGFLRKPLTIKSIATAARAELDREIEEYSDK